MFKISSLKYNFLVKLIYFYLNIYNIILLQIIFFNKSVNKEKIRIRHFIIDNNLTILSIY